jgi:alcohol dehydrogenase
MMKKSNYFFMKAIIRTQAGKEFSSMQVQTIPSPSLQADEVKVRMASSRINPVDMDLMKGMPFLKYKKPQIGGLDGAGTIIEMGQNVKDFKVGDAVFFYRKFTDIGTWAEEISIKATDIALIPKNISVEQAGSIALPLLTAYESLWELKAQKGETILIHGAGGGVGFPAVQIANYLGFKVIATASPNDMDDLKRARADRIINYRSEKFEEVLKIGETDYVFDLLGKDILLKSIALKPKKIVSLHYIEPQKMSKVGINLPSILQWIMKLSMGKFDKQARKNGVQLIGQITGANGKLLTKAVELVNQKPFIVRKSPTISLSEIEKRGLNKADLGKVIVF